MLLGIVVAGTTLGGAIEGGVSAGMAGGDVGDVFSGIGKGAVNGFVLGGGIALTIGGFAVGGLTNIGSIMAIYGISITANMLEVAVTQNKKSIYDGDSYWEKRNDVNNAMFANSGRIVVGRISGQGLVIMGTRMFSKAWTLTNFFSEVNYMAQYWKYSKAMSIVSKTFWISKANCFSLFVGYSMAVYQVYNLGKAFFSTPDFNSDKWILY